jgi:hypothetical protein
MYLLQHHGHFVTSEINVLFFQPMLVLDALVQFVIPLSILTVVTVKLISMLRKRAQLRRDMGRAPIAEDKSISVILVAILITFLICQIVNCITLIWIVVINSGYEPSHSDNAWLVFTYFDDVAPILTCVNSAANGFIYFFCNKHFRRDLVSHCKCGSIV